MKSIDVSISENKELTISYIELAASTATRREQLLSQYCFTCHCDRCEQRLHDSLLLGQINNELIDHVSGMVKAAQRLQQRSQFLEAKEAFERIYREQSHNLTLTHEIILTTCNALAHIYVELQDFRKALQYAHNTVPGFEICYPRYYPLLGLQYAMIGKLYWYFEETENAFKFLKKAYDVLKITHGHGKYEIVDQLREMCIQAQAELSFKQQQ